MQGITLGSSSKLRLHHLDNGDRQINLHLKENDLEMIRLNRYPGVQIYSQLKWREQTSFTIGKISKATGMLQYTKKYLPLEPVKTSIKL